jgi:hypothetical protein
VKKGNNKLQEMEDNKCTRRKIKADGCVIRKHLLDG